MQFKTLAFSCCLMAAVSVAPAHADDSALTTFGDYAQIGVPVAAGLISLYHGDKKGLFQLVEGAVYTAALTHGLKFAINAERPDGGDHSFPSGHTSAASQGAAYLQ